MVGQCELKLIDFGMAEIVPGPLRLPKESTAHYLAPEVMRVNRRMQGVPGYGLDADAFEKCIESAPKVHQKYIKSASKVHQKCTKSASKMHQKCIKMH